MELPEEHFTKWFEKTTVSFINEFDKKIFIRFTVMDVTSVTKNMFLFQFYI